MAVPAVRRLPGIRFEAPAPPLDEVLPRMDIAAFVGLAASGPVHVPVAIESIAAFEAIFGARAPLAWDLRRGQTLDAQLAPAVRAFFRGGGRRCWVVRVADRPAFNFFPLAGLARASGGAITPAFARSRAAGSWSDPLRVAATLMASPIEATGFSHNSSASTAEIALVAPDDLVTGDLFRVDFESGRVAFVVARQLTPFPASPPSQSAHVSASGSVWWFRPSLAVASGTSAQAVVYTRSASPSGRNEVFAGGPVPVVNPPSAWEASGSPGSFELDLEMALADAPAPGSLVSVAVGSDQLWMSVRDVGILAEHLGVARLQLTGNGLWWTPTAPSGSVGKILRCERLSLELWAQSNGDPAMRLSDLGLTPDHPRYWADLRDDDERYAPASDEIAPRKQLWDEPPFAVAGAGQADAVYLPIDVAILPDAWLGAARQPLTPLERDGASRFTAALFLDRDLITPQTETVMGTAEHVRYISESPRRLEGIHAALEIDEVTIVAAPDAEHVGWQRAEIQNPPAPAASAPPQQAVDCGKPVITRPTFIDCRTRVIDPPQWAARFQSPPQARIDANTFTLEWTAPAGETFVVEEAHRPYWSDTATISSGTSTSLTLYGRPRGAYYYRVRAMVDGQTSAWSAGLTIVVSGLDQWVVSDEQDYSPDTILAVHRGLLRMAAARGDLFALLGLPAHYRADAAVRHLRSLTDAAADPIAVIVRLGIGSPAGAVERTAFSLPIGAGESRSFSFGALYHPWAFVSEQPGAPALALVSPDGLAAGLLAKRALSRGAWIAPGNEALPNVLALAPVMSSGDVMTLLDAQINAIVQEPRGFVPVSASTLSADEDLEPINVRRLLSLLRRLALREGATYVFEPNDDAFRRAVQRGFEAWLTRMFERGAFAGATAATAFQVVVDSSVNTRPSVDAGRFIVELRVAPSRPMTFLTVRLVQSGDRATVAEVV